MDNLEKNTYAKAQMTKALLKLLETHSLDSITISKITQCAGVSRMTFYRNYHDKTDILRQKISQLMDDWWQEYMASEVRTEEAAWGSMFAHIKKHQKFYLILFENNIEHMILDCFIGTAGPTPEMDNRTAYFRARFTYALYGWVCEWVKRGMQESANEIAELIRDMKT